MSGIISPRQGLAGFGNPATVTVTAMFVLSAGLTNVISNNAVAVLLAPIAIEMAGSMGVDVRLLLMGITYAASLAFLSPVGYQTNTLIYGPGQYRFTDFARVGTALSALFLAIGVLLIPVVWSF